MSCRACSTCSRWTPYAESHGRHREAVGLPALAPEKHLEMFGMCSLAGDTRKPTPTDVVFLGDGYEDGDDRALYTRIDFNCGWWEEKP